MYQIKKDSNKFFYVSCKAGNGKILWRSEPFKTKQSLWVFLRAFARTIESPSELTHIVIFDLSLKDVAKEYHLSVFDENETLVMEYKRVK